MTVTIGFLGNLMYDTRTYNLYHSLKEDGHAVRFIGFDWLTNDFQTTRSSHILIKQITKGSLSIIFYIRFAFLLFYHLMQKTSDAIWAADFFSLPLCYLAAKLQGAHLFYDSREIYTEVHGIASRPLLKRCVYLAEKFFVRRCDQVFVTGAMDLQVIHSLYLIENISLLRNLPRYKQIQNSIDYSTIFKNGKQSPILLYQGTLIRGRGISFCLDIVKAHPTCQLVLLGGGEHEDEFKAKARFLGIEHRVYFAGKIPQDQLMRYTAGADTGLCLINNVSKSNALALPNKLFEYIMAGLPVIVTDLPQMREIVDQYHVGKVVHENDLQQILSTLDEWTDRPENYRALKNNCISASRTLNWETEFNTVKAIFEK